MSDLEKSKKDLKESLERIAQKMPGSFKLGTNIIKTEEIAAINAEYDGKYETSYDIKIQLKGGNEVKAKLAIGELPAFEKIITTALEEASKISYTNRPR